LAALCGLVAGQSAISANMSPIDKVVTLLEEMKSQVSKEAKEDEEAYNKYACWCTNGRAEKTEAIADAEKRITSLEAFLEQAAGTEAQLKNEIAALADDIAKDQDSLESAAGVRTKEETEFTAETEDMKECIAALKEASTVLKKVQLVQHDGPKAKTLLLQLKHMVASMEPRVNKYRNVLTRDLFDVLGSLDDEAGARKMRGSRSELSALEQPAAGGAAAGSKSYNSRSGGILGMIDGMKDEFESNLAAAQKAELEAEIEFQHLKAAKLSEIHAASTQKTQKEKAMSDTKAKAAEAKEDLESTKEQLSADDQILLNLEKNCKTEEEEYKKRVKVRSEESVAIAETIKILTSDETRELFGKTLSFLQVDADEAVKAAQKRAVNKAVAHILRVARKNQDWSFASIAVKAKLDGFTKVKEAMDKMTAELKTQMEEETEKYRFCTKEIDETEDTIKVKNIEKDDLSEKKLNLENAIATSTSEIDTLDAEEKAEMVSLKKAGEDRKAENLLFQQSVADQRATVFVLKKALARLEEFYVKKGFLQVNGKAALDPAPAKPSSTQYEKSGSSGGVMQMMQMIISDASNVESELVIDEKNAQANFATFSQDTMAAIEAKRLSITEKSKLKEEAAAELATTEESLLTNGEQLKSLEGELSGLHGDCDYIVKYYDLRQKSRQEEIDAIAEAKAILSGANFGF